jgi:hypothetical protein
MAALALLAISSVASAGIVDPAFSSATCASCPGTMTVSPGGADGFTNPVDNTIDVYLNDSGGNPVSVVASDISVSDPEIVWCAGGVIADSSTYPPDEGHTTFTGTPRGGVMLDALCGTAQTLDVIAVGNLIASFDLSVVSPDLNGDGDVSVADFAIFADVFQGIYDCANLDKSTETAPDPNVTVADFAVFASFFNISDCP